MIDLENLPQVEVSGLSIAICVAVGDVEGCYGGIQRKIETPAPKHRAGRDVRRGQPCVAAFYRKTNIRGNCERKKPEFGPGDLAASQTNIRGAKHLYLLEAGSSIMINRQSQPTNAKDIRFDLYDN